MMDDVDKVYQQEEEPRVLEMKVTPRPDSLGILLQVLVVNANGDKRYVAADIMADMWGEDGTVKAVCRNLKSFSRAVELKAYHPSARGQQ